ncbi:MAG: alpha-glucan family phosphorylase [Acidobacteria bacterium]|uniref:glycogen phosphorylase n=1 Tax=Candidatus Polarisedimenticola svalbardensis TaxID=2886004 RepID=A0A8J6Y7D8_9BACT|nr:alpha-glucan family phosphorylase [Candidatus Polarisedimenticola svalbardensis]
MKEFDIPTLEPSELEIPEELNGLRELVYNLWWCWSPEAHLLFHRIDGPRWQHYRNPVELLLGLEPHRWEQLQNDPVFMGGLHDVVGQLRRYMQGDPSPWFRQSFPDYGQGPFAYFSTEFGWHESLGIYSGGLGILSGDHCKSASDLGLPFIGIGLMYRRGYFRQTIDLDGLQQHFYPDYDNSRLPLELVAGKDGRELRISVDFPGREVQARAWRAQVGRAPVLLLDTDLPENRPEDRPITSILYVRGREMRLCQEIILGVGGARTLEALGIQPAVWHMNEGHSAFLGLERTRLQAAADGTGFHDAMEAARQNAVFTTHTPVPAGNESFQNNLIRKYFTGFAEKCGIEMDTVLATGRIHDDKPDEGFNLTALAIRTAGSVNGVSALHGDVADGIWRHMGRDLADDDRLVGSVTNGVHTPTWIGPEIRALLQEHLGTDFLMNLMGSDFSDRVLAIPDEAIWSAHQEQKKRLIELTRDRLMEQFARHGKGPDELAELENHLSPDHLTIGFARRFATYKRAALVFRDVERLKAIVASDDRPVQILFAGKAHPADRPGQDLIREIFVKTLSPDWRGRIHFIENYNMRIARFLVQGVDVWLNTPRRPQEASGTSGMKVALNGGLNCSILDGWWCEGFDEAHGWAIGNNHHTDDHDEQDKQDADALYHVLEDMLVPAYYQEGGGPPAGWIARMKRAIADLAPRFSTARMVREYTERYYLPASRK